MNVLDLFSGIGGISLGLEWAGMRTVGFCEVDPACRFWLSRRWPGVPIFEDVRSLTGERIAHDCGPVDLLAGGFPCQPHSVAGKRRGAADERHLWPEFARLVREVRPRWVLAENVPGLRTTAADEVLADLEAAGYACWPLVVGADDVGAPHRRKRVWIVGRLGLAVTEHGRREQSGRRSGPGWSDATAIGDGSPSLAHAARDGQRGEPAPERPDRERTWTPSDGSVADSRRRNDRSEGCAESSRRFFPGWPARPGEPQHEWEAPRLADAKRGGRARWPPVTEREAGERIALEGTDQGRSGEGVTGEPESRLGGATDGLPRRLARGRSASRRVRLKALGNSVVPQVVVEVGRAILELDRP